MVLLHHQYSLIRCAFCHLAASAVLETVPKATEVDQCLLSTDWLQVLDLRQFVGPNFHEVKDVCLFLPNGSGAEVMSR